MWLCNDLRTIQSHYITSLRDSHCRDRKSVSGVLCKDYAYTGAGTCMYPVIKLHTTIQKQEHINKWICNWNPDQFCSLYKCESWYMFISILTLMEKQWKSYGTCLDFSSTFYDAETISKWKCIQSICVWNFFKDLNKLMKVLYGKFNNSKEFDTALLQEVLNV